MKSFFTTTLTPTAIDRDKRLSIATGQEIKTPVEVQLAQPRCLLMCLASIEIPNKREQSNLHLRVSDEVGKQPQTCRS